MDDSPMTFWEHLKEDAGIWAKVMLTVVIVASLVVAHAMLSIAIFGEMYAVFSIIPVLVEIYVLMAFLEWKGYL